ncbi:MAG TPA: hypothetical protein VER58_18100 [Thermoanaerobaculia bacterium]|nr:hypothetical protein [Thermoanaerobaculia bacterium]
MHPKQFVSILLVLAAASCSRSGKMQRNQQQYDAVQEGSAQGVTSTISGPGETPQPLTTSTVTGTNVDTTTAFTVPGTATTTSTQQPGTIASTLPESTTGFPSGYTPPRPRPRPRTPPPQTDTAAPPTTTDTSGPQKNRDDQKPPPPTHTTGTQG